MFLVVAFLVQCSLLRSCWGASSQLH